MPLLQKTLAEFFGEKISESPDYCRIVSERHFTRLSSLLDRTEGNVVIGGKGDKDAKFMEPTVVTGVTMNDSLMQVSAVNRYSSIFDFKINIRRSYLAQFYRLCGPSQ